MLAEDTTMSGKGRSDEVRIVRSVCDHRLTAIVTARSTRQEARDTTTRRG